MAINSKLIKDNSSNYIRTPVYLKNDGLLTNSDYVNYGFDIGDIKLTTSTLSSTYWHLCNGASISPTTHSALWNKLNSGLNKNTPVDKDGMGLFPSSEVQGFTSFSDTEFVCWSEKAWWHSNSISGPWTKHNILDTNYCFDIYIGMYKVNGYYIYHIRDIHGNSSSTFKTQICYSTSLTGTWNSVIVIDSIYRSCRLVYWKNRYWASSCPEGTYSQANRYYSYLLGYTSLTAMSSNATIKFRFTAGHGTLEDGTISLLLPTSNYLYVFGGPNLHLDEQCGIMKIGTDFSTLTDVGQFGTYDEHISMWDDATYIYICENEDYHDYSYYYTIEKSSGTVTMIASDQHPSLPFVTDAQDNLRATAPIRYNSGNYLFHPNYGICKSTSNGLSSILSLTSFGACPPEFYKHGVSKFADIYDCGSNNNMPMYIYYNPINYIKVFFIPRWVRTDNTAICYTNLFCTFPNISINGIKAYAKISH